MPCSDGKFKQSLVAAGGFVFFSCATDSFSVHQSFFSSKSQFLRVNSRPSKKSKLLKSLQNFSLLNVYCFFFTHLCSFSCCRIQTPGTTNAFCQRRPERVYSLVHQEVSGALLALVGKAGVLFFLGDQRIYYGSKGNGWEYTWS